MTRFDQFIAGDDALARLIRQQAAFEPSAEQEARLFAAIGQFVQAAPPHETWDFEPPAHMESAFLEEAKRIAQAQAPRRAATLEQLRQGKSAQQVFGQVISARTAQWLAQLQAFNSTSPSKPHTTTRSTWWSWSGMVLASVFAGAIGFQWLTPLITSPQLEATAVAEQAAPEAALTTKMTESLRLAEQEDHSTQFMAERQAKTEKRKELKQLAQQAARQRALSDEQAQRIKSAPLAANLMQQDTTAQTESPAAAPAAAAPAPLALAAPPSVATLELEKSAGMTMAEVNQHRAAKKLASQAPAPVMQSARMASAPMPQTLLFALDSAPEQAATHIPNAWLAQGLRVQSADIHAIDFENWLKVLRAALPAQTQIKLETNPAIAAGTLAISQLEPE